MTTITIELPDDLADRVSNAATERGVAPEQLARDALAEQFPPPRHLSIIGIGASGAAEPIAEQHKEIRRGQFSDKTAPDV
jgi:predicted transcriptional regulator